MIDLKYLLEKEEDNNTSPVIQTDGVTFAYIKHNNVYCILLHCYYLVCKTNEKWRVGA